MSSSLDTAEAVFDAIESGEVRQIDLRFTGLSGPWRRVSASPRLFYRDAFSHGLTFEGASVSRSGSTGKEVASLVPDPASAFLDPFGKTQTLVLVCNVHDRATGEASAFDARSIAKKAESYLHKTEICEAANFALNIAGSSTSSVAAHGAEAREIDIPRRTPGSAPTPQANARHSITTQAIETLKTLGLAALVRNDDGVAGDEAPPGPTNLTRVADATMIYRYVVENVAHSHVPTGSVAPDRLECVGGVRVQQSLWHNGRPLFAGDGYAGSSALMRHYFAGLVDHAAALLAICALTADRSACQTQDRSPLALPLRAAVCHTHKDRQAKTANRVEFHCPDLSGSPYLAFAAMLMAGLDGFQNRLYDIDPDEPIDTFCDHGHRERARAALPRSIDDARRALDSDHEFLLRGGVFTPETLDALLGQSASYGLGSRSSLMSV